MRYFLDRNIIIVYLLNDKTRMYIDEEYTPFSSPNIPIISVVTVGEIKSIAIRNKWGKKKLEYAEEIYKKCVVVGINKKPIIETYGSLDAFSQGKLESQPLTGSSRNMGKNDLWIAASAIASNATLLTLDYDFEHLNNVFLSVKMIDRIR